jgi:hypothetical protein
MLIFSLQLILETLVSPPVLTKFLSFAFLQTMSLMLWWCTDTLTLVLNIIKIIAQWALILTSFFHWHSTVTGKMDLHTLMVGRTNSCTTPLERYKFNDIFWKLIMGTTPVWRFDLPLISWETKQTSLVALETSCMLRCLHLKSVKQNMICVPLLHAFLPKELDASHYFRKGLTSRAMSTICWIKFFLFHVSYAQYASYL